jgi:xanthine dehydrogenase small subunit
MSVRNHVVFYINGQRFTVSDDRIFMPLANFLRYEAERTGTKIVCAEGDCGACTVLFASPEFGADATEALSYKSCNSCIVPVYKMDGCSIITVEGVQIDRQTLDPVQQAFVDCNASQCGFVPQGSSCPVLDSMNRMPIPRLRM